MTERQYLSVSDILILHKALIEKFGGEDGVLNFSGLQSAVARPQAGYYSNIQAEACALFQSLWLNHPFVDGNKRVAVAALDTFLRINGCRLMTSHRELQEVFLNLSDSLLRDFNSLTENLSSLIIQD